MEKSNHSRITDEIKLISDAGILSFQLKESMNAYAGKTLSKVFDFIVELSPDALPNINNRKPLIVSFYTHDLQRLSIFFKSYYEKLLETVVTESDVYMGVVPDITFQCTDGSRNGSEEDYLSIRIMFNYGRPYREGSSVYYGFEAVALSKDILKFCQEIDDFVESQQSRECIR